MFTVCQTIQSASLVVDSCRKFLVDIHILQIRKRQPTRLPRPWILQARTRVGCHCLLQCMKVKSESEAAQSWLTRSDPRDCRLPGASVHRIFQARVLEWGAIAFSAIIPNNVQTFPIFKTRGKNMPLIKHLPLATVLFVSFGCQDFSHSVSPLRPPPSPPNTFFYHLFNLFGCAGS